MTDRTCPLGEDCDLAVAWMAGAEDQRKHMSRKLAEAADRIEALKAQHANDCEMIARLREVLSGRTLDETHESFWKEKVRQLEAALAKADDLAEAVDAHSNEFDMTVEDALAAYRQARDATR